VSSASAWGQAASAGFGAVAGTILQSNTDGFPDVQVILSNPDLAIALKLTTSDDGIFLSTSVVPAAGYSLKATHKGYFAWQSDKFTVSAGKTVNFRISLEADNVENGPRSAGKMDLVDTTKIGVTEIVTAQEVRQLPSGGVRLDEVIPLAPAVTVSEGVPGLIVMHALPWSNVLLTDGIDTTDSYPLLNPGISRQVSQNAIDSVQVLSLTSPDAFGRAMGGIVDTSTQSGGTAYHGSGYTYYRDPSMAANDAFAAGYDLRQKQHLTGANVEGPVWGNRIFFFVDLEAMNRDAQGLNRISSPLIANPAGTAVLASNCVIGPTTTTAAATAAQCAAATKFLQSQMNVTAPFWEHSDLGLARLDYRRKDGNAVSVEANAMHWRAPSLAQSEAVAPNGGLLGDPLLHEEARFVNVGWTSVLTPSMSNDLHAGWYKDRNVEYPSSPLPSTGFTGIAVAGTNVGATQKYTTTVPNETRYQLVENFHSTVNSHQFLAGGDLSDTGDTINSLANASGLYTYPSLTSFADDFSGGGTKTYTSYNQTVGNPNRTFHARELNVFASDTWRASDRLTVNLGLRYERPKLPQPTEVNTSYYATGVISSPGLDLAPRAGFAYKVSDKTVIRAGYGFYYAPFPGQFVDELFLGNGLYQTNITVNPNQTGAPIFPNVVSATGLPKGASNLFFANSKLRNPLAQEGSALLETHIGRYSSLTFGYNRSRGYKLWTAVDLNLVTPTKLETYTIDNLAGQAVATYLTSYWTGKNDANFGHLYNLQNNGSIWYQSGTAQWQSQFSHGLSLSAVYTYTYSRDDLGANSALGFALIGSYTGDVNNDKGSSAYYQPQRGVIRSTWQPTVDRGPVANALVNGWILSGIATLASGQPVTPLVSVQGQQFSGVIMPYTSSLNGTGGWSRVPFEPVGSLHTAPQYNLDMRLARRVSFTERVKGTFSIEAYNLTNRQSATLVNAIEYLSVAPLATGLASGPTAGILKPVPGAGAGIASQGFPDGTTARRVQLEFRISF
jgi:hypothetical protein